MKKKGRFFKTKSTKGYPVRIYFSVINQGHTTTILERVILMPYNDIVEAIDKFEVVRVFKFSTGTVAIFKQTVVMGLENLFDTYHLINQVLYDVKDELIYPPLVFTHKGE